MYMSIKSFFLFFTFFNSAIWLWDDLSEGYGVSDNELTLVATIPNFDNDTLMGSEITFGSI